MSNFIIPNPLAMTEAERARMTISCRDSDNIPKVASAGQIVEIDGQRVQIMHNGLRVVAGGYYGDWMASIIEGLRGHHEPQEETVFHEVLKHVGPQASMIELGGFWSYYSLWFMQNFPNRTSIVLEPDPNNLQVGRANAALNQAGIQFVQACAGDVSKDSIAFHTETAGAVDIPQLCVADLMTRFGLSTLDILHCDTQGAETQVIRSCEALMRSGRIKFGIFSTHSHYISGDPLTHQRCLQMLREFGGTILAEHDVHESFSGDGLIAVYFGAQKIDWKEPPISLNRYSTSLFRNPLYDLAAASSTD